MPVENKPGSAPKKPGGVTGKGFQKGQSGNPGGRPKGLMNAVREEVGDERVLARIAMDIAQGKPALGGLTRDPQDGEPLSAVPRKVIVPSFDNRLDALQFLRDTGWGKPVQAVDMNLTSNQGGVLIMLPPEDDQETARDAEEPAAGHHEPPEPAP